MLLFLHLNFATKVIFFPSRAKYNLTKKGVFCPQKGVFFDKSPPYSKNY